MYRILVAHNVSATRSGGMSRIMGYTHDRIAKHGFTVDEFNASHAPSYAKGRMARLGFGVAVYKHIRQEYLAGRPYDIVNIHECSAACTIKFRRRCGDPTIVVTSHGVEQRAWEFALEELKLGRSGPSLKTRMIYPISQLMQSNYSLRYSDHIFCLNNEDKVFICNRFHRDANCVTRIYPGAQVEYNLASTNRDYQRCKTLLFAGVWRKNKGIEDLVPAIELVLQKHPEIKLAIFGGGFPDEFIKKSFPTSIRHAIEIRRSSSEKETIEIFASSDVLVLPSLFEGTPLVLMEAMMCGLPIVTTATCGMKDVIKSSENGLLVPIRSPTAIAESTLQLLSDSSLRKSLGRAASKTAKECYTWDKVSEPIAKIYLELASTSNRSS